MEETTVQEYFIRFVRKIEQNYTTGCWEWNGTKSSNGYGYFKVWGTMILAHRFAYTSMVGPIPEGMVLHHECKNRNCVNPEHIKCLTYSEHKLLHPHPDPGKAQRDKTHCPYGHEYTKQNTYNYKGSRQCRACKRRTNFEQNAKYKESLNA